MQFNPKGRSVFFKWVSSSLERDRIYLSLVKGQRDRYMQSSRSRHHVTQMACFFRRNTCFRMYSMSSRFLFWNRPVFRRYNFFVLLNNLPRVLYIYTIYIYILSLWVILYIYHIPMPVLCPAICVVPCPSASIRVWVIIWIFFGLKTKM